MSARRKWPALGATLGVALAASLCFVPAAANAPASVGIAAALLNRVSIARGGTAQMRPAVLRQQVALADRVETGARSQLQILLLDRSTFTVGANARLTIDRFVYDPSRGRSVGATVTKGAFRFMSGRPSRGGDSAIATPAASIGIRGTIVDGVVGADAITIANGERAIGGGHNPDPQSATLVILRGPGANTRGNVLPGAISVSAGGRTVELDRPLLAVFVPRAGAQPIGPFAMSLPGLTRVQALIFPSLAEWRLATTPAPRGPYPVPPPQRRNRPVLIGDPAGLDPAGGSYPGGRGPGYGAGIPSLPDLPARGMDRPAQAPPPRTSPPRTPPPQSPDAGPTTPSGPAPDAGMTPPDPQPESPPPSNTPQSTAPEGPPPPTDYPPTDMTGDRPASPPPQPDPQYEQSQYDESQSDRTPAANRSEPYGDTTPSVSAQKGGMVQ